MRMAEKVLQLAGTLLTGGLGDGQVELEIGNANAFEETKGKLEGVGTCCSLVLFLICISH